MIDQNRDGIIDVSDLQAIYQQIGKSECWSLLPKPLHYTLAITPYAYYITSQLQI